MKSDLAHAQFGRAWRAIDLTSQVLKMHPQAFRLYVLSVDSGHLVDLDVPVYGAWQLRNGFRMFVNNRGIGGTGDVRIRLPGTPLYWDFSTNDWTATSNSNCLIGPGEIAFIDFYGHFIDLDFETWSEEWTAPTDTPAYYCHKKNATKSTVRAIA